MPKFGCGSQTRNEHQGQPVSLPNLGCPAFSARFLTVFWDHFRSSLIGPLNRHRRRDSQCEDKSGNQKKKKISQRTRKDKAGLVAQMRDAPHITQHLFEIVSQRGYRNLFCLQSSGIAQVSLRYLFCTGVSHLKCDCYGEGYHTQSLHI